MSALAAQKLLVAGGATGLLVVVVWLVRSGHLAVRYGLGWLAVALAMLTAAPFLGVIETVADFFGLTPTGVLIGLVVLFLVIACLHLSVSLSGAQNRIRTLSESNALLDARVRRLGDTRGVGLGRGGLHASDET